MRLADLTRLSELAAERERLLKELANPDIELRIRGLMFDYPVDDLVSLAKPLARAWLSKKIAALESQLRAGGIELS